MNQIRKYWGKPAVAVLFLATPTAALSASDFSSPRKTLETLQQAIQTHDVKTLRACFDLGDAPGKAAAQTYLDAWEASLHFQEAMEKHFGQAGVDAIRGKKTAPALLDAKTNWAAAGTLTTDGPSALLTVEPDATGNFADKPTQLRLKEIQGQWKIDAAALFTLDDPQTKTQLGLMAQITEALKSVTQDIDAGKIAAAQQAQQLLVQRVIPLLKPVEKSPASAPATNP